MKSRFLKEKLLNGSKNSRARIVVLTGARQTGKTTLAKYCFPDYSYLSIEDPVLRTQYKQLTAGQWATNYPKAILYEVQKEPVLIESIKSAYDQFENVKYLLLGSSQLLLLKKVKESLAGRCVIEEVLPLTIPELRTKSWDDQIKPSFFQRYITSFDIGEMLPSFTMYNDYSLKKNAFEYYLTYGGYPAITDEILSDNERFDWLKTYVKTYLERDVRDLASFNSLEPFVKIQRISALLTGETVNFSQLGNEAAVSSKTAQRFLNYLEISYQTILLQPWHSNKLKRLVKSPKLHYLDPGVQRAILQKRGAVTGNEFESAVVAEIYKQTKIINLNGSLYHLRTHDGTEVDLLLEMENGFVAFEIKMTEYVSKKHVRHLQNLDKILTKPIIQSFVLSNDNSIKRFSDKIIAIPAAMFLG